MVFLSDIGTMSNDRRDDAQTPETQSYAKFQGQSGARRRERRDADGGAFIGIRRSRQPDQALEGPVA